MKIVLRLPYYRSEHTKYEKLCPVTKQMGKKFPREIRLLGSLCFMAKVSELSLSVCIDADSCHLFLFFKAAVRVRK